MIPEDSGSDVVVETRACEWEYPLEGGKWNT